MCQLASSLLGEGLETIAVSVTDAFSRQISVTIDYLFHVNVSGLVLVSKFSRSVY